MSSPTITTVTPGSGPPGTTVTILGTGFSGVTAVSVGGVAVPFKLVSDTSITFLIPSGMATGVDDIDLTYTGDASTGFTVTPPPPSMKTPLAGIISQDIVPPSPTYDWMDGYVVNGRWAQFQAHAGGPLLPGNPYAVAVTALQAWNKAHGANRGIRGRLFVSSRSPGTNSIEWPQQLGGAPIAVQNSQGDGGSVGHYWDTQEYQPAYADLEAKLYAEFGDVLEFREHTLAGASLLYPEPLLKYSSAALTAAGLTVALDKASYVAMMNAHAVWLKGPTVTLQTFSFNPALLAGEGGAAYTVSLMSSFKKQFGSAGIVMNNSIRDHSLGVDYDTVFAAMKASGGIVAFQVAAPSRMGQWQPTWQSAVSYGARSLEVTSTEYLTLTSAQLSAAQTALLANAA